ncbi:MAG: thrombospondin type 3 repeat-containing protein [Candidatus Woesearchaeota archaeon]
MKKNLILLTVLCLFILVFASLGLADDDECEDGDDNDGDGETDYGDDDECGCDDDDDEDSIDTDGDGLNNCLDSCPNDSDNDIDNDGICGDIDNCPNNANPSQVNTDGDTFGDVCDNCIYITNQEQDDNDDDGYGDICDNCPDVPNPGQEDFDDDGIGDACEEPPEECPTLSMTLLTQGFYPGDNPIFMEWNYVGSTDIYVFGFKQNGDYLGLVYSGDAETEVGSVDNIADYGSANIPNALGLIYELYFFLDSGIPGCGVTQPIEKSEANASSTAVPEFSTIGMAMVMVIVAIGGYMITRKRKK